MTGSRLKKRLSSRRQWGWNPVDRLCRNFYRCCKSNRNKQGLCHCRCYRTIKKKMYRAIRRTRSRKGRRTGHKIRRMLKFHRCYCEDDKYCKTSRKCRVENVCRFQKRICTKGRCRWVRKKTCSRQVQCYLTNRCVQLTRNGNGGRCDSRSVILKNSVNQYRVRYLNKITKR